MFRRLILSLAVAGLAVPASLAPTAALASPPPAHKKVCRHSAGTTGLIAGGAAGAVIGSKVIGGGIAGPAVGAVGGAFAGRAIDRTITAKKRCK